MDMEQENKQLLNKQNRTIMVAVLGVIFGCTAILMCLLSFMHLLELVGVSYSRTTSRLLSWISLISNLGIVLAFIAIPVVFFFLLLYKRNGKEKEPPAE